MEDIDPVAVIDDEDMAPSLALPPIGLDCHSPRIMVRSLSDGGSTPVRLSPSPFIIQVARNSRSKDDSSLIADTSQPTTPLRPFDLARRGLTLQMPPRGFSRSASVSTSTNAFASPVTSAYSNPSASTAATVFSATSVSSGVPSPVAFANLQAPFIATRATPTHTPTSPKFDHSQVFSSPTSVVSRRSRGLDFSRAATSLHHSMLADQSSADSSPTIDSGAFNGTHSTGPLSAVDKASQTATGHATSSLWSMMGSQERMLLATSQCPPNPPASDSSSSSGGDDFMDEDMEEAYVLTPLATRSAISLGPGLPIQPQTPFTSSLLSYQQRRRPRKQPKKRLRGPLGLGFSPNPITVQSRSPPNALGPLGNLSRDLSGCHSRRESISWQANRLQLSGSESEESSRHSGEKIDGVIGNPSLDGQRGVIRKPVTRRGNLLVSPFLLFP